MTTTVTPRKLENGYCHSHGGGVGYFSEVCYGEGPIADTMFGTGNGIKRLEGFLHALKAYLEWEHYAEHGGGIKANMLPGKFKVKAVRDLQDAGHIVEDMFPHVIRIPNLSELLVIQLDDGRVQVYPTDEFEEELAKILRYKLREDQDNVVVVKDGEGYVELPYTVQDMMNDGEKIPGEAVLNFNGKDIYLKVVNEDLNEINIQGVAHPQITQRICQKLGMAFTKFATRKGARLQTRDSDQSKVSGPSFLSLRKKRVR